MGTILKSLYFGRGLLGTPKLAYQVPAATQTAVKEIVVSNVSGPIGGAASFPAPVAICVDGAGNMYVAFLNCIKKITPDGAVTTLSGAANTSGNADGAGGAPSLTRWNAIAGMCIDGTGTYLYVSDGANNKVKRVTCADGTTVTCAGSGAAGVADSTTGTTATLTSPGALCMAPNSLTIYVASTNNGGTINLRKIAVSGVPGAANAFPVTTIAGTALGAGQRYVGLVCDPNNTYLFGVNQYFNNPPYRQDVRRIAIGTGVAIIVDGAVGSAAGFLNLKNGNSLFGDSVTVSANTIGIALDTSGPNWKLYVSDPGNHAIRSIDLLPLTAAYATFDAVTNTAVGAGPDIWNVGQTGVSGLVNGFPGTARTSYPGALFLKNGSLYIGTAADGIQRLSLPDMFCHNFAGGLGLGPNVTNYCTDGAALSYGYTGYCNVYFVPSLNNAGAALGTLDTNLHCVYRSVAVNGATTNLLARNKSMGPYDAIYIEPCTPGLNFDISGLEGKLMENTTVGPGGVQTGLPSLPYPEAPPADYREARIREYPAVGDQLDAIWKGGAAQAAMRQTVMDVKARHPKPAPPPPPVDPTPDKTPKEA